MEDKWVVIGDHFVNLANIAGLSIEPADDTKPADMWELFIHYPDSTYVACTSTEARVRLMLDSIKAVMNHFNISKEVFELK